MSKGRDIFSAVNGQWLAWETWSVCDVTCGEGQLRRKRSCNGPFYGGKPCPGDAEQISSCHTNNCPGKKGV